MFAGPWPARTRANPSSRTTAAPHRGTLFLYMGGFERPVQANMPGACLPGRGQRARGRIPPPGRPPHPIGVLSFCLWGDSKGGSWQGAGGMFARPWYRVPSSRHSRCGRWLKTCHRHIFFTPRRRKANPPSPPTENPVTAMVTGFFFIFFSDV